MEWYALLPLVALASALTTQESQDHMQYLGKHRRPCGEAQFSVLVADSQNYTLRSTGIPTHAAFRTSPYRAAIQELTYTFPREPVPLEHPLCVPSGVPIGFALDGVPFYNPLSKDWNNAVEGSCAQVYDRCGGNVDKNNQYYYSELPNFDRQCLDLNTAQQVHIGVAIDGFPIYYEQHFNASALDECGGRYLDTTNKRFYRYVVSNQFPYTIGCFRGKVQNISTLTPCKGHEEQYGSLCACVNVGPPGMAVGYKWLEKDAVTVGQCTRRPAIQERERAIICNREEIPEPEFLEEDRRSKTCVDFRALYSLIVIQGHKGGLAPWTRLKNYGKEEDMEEREEREEREEDSEYIRHFKALRWLLSDLDLLDYPELEKYEKMMKNRIKPLCPKQQRKLRNALVQIWVVAFLREANKLRPEASDYEKEEVEKAFHRLMYVLKTLKALEITAFAKKPEKKEPMDPWGVWTADHEGDDNEEEIKKDENKLGALISQLTALQTLGQMKEGEKKDGKKSEGGDGNNEIRARIRSLLWEIQSMSGDRKHKEKGGMGRREGDSGEGYRGEGYRGEGYRGEGYRGEGYRGEGYRGEGYRGEGYRGEGYRGEAYRGEGYGGEGYCGEGYGGEGYCGEAYGGEGYGGEGYRGEGYHGEGYRGEGYRGEGYRGEGYRGEGYRGEGYRGEGYRGEGYRGEGYRGGGDGGEGYRGEGYRGEGYGRGGKEEGDCDEDYEMHEEGMEGMREGEYGMRRRGRYQRKGIYLDMVGGYGMGGMRREGGRPHGKEGEGEAGKTEMPGRGEGRQRAVGE